MSRGVLRRGDDWRFAIIEVPPRAPAAGRLDVIATPIGNLGDLTPRARDALAAADLIAAEDTRRTQGLLSSLGLARPVLSLHAHNEPSRIEGILAQLRAGKVVALVSDAGTPLLSDPGFALVRATVAAGLDIRAIPGVSALTAALSVAGLPTDRFAFEGFLPARGAQRQAALDSLAGESRTLVFFEAPHRVADTLADLARSFGADRPAAVGRELTKLHETVYRDTLGALAERAVQDANFSRGELTLVVGGAPRGEQGSGDRALLLRALRLLQKDLPPARAAAIAGQLAGVGRHEAYQVARQLRTAAGDEEPDGS